MLEGHSEGIKVPVSLKSHDFMHFSCLVWLRSLCFGHPAVISGLMLVTFWILPVGNRRLIFCLINLVLLIFFVYSLRNWIPISGAALPFVGK